MMKWLKRIFMGLLGLFLVVFLAGWTFETYSRVQAKKDYPPPGQMVDIGGRFMQLDCRGSGEPVVVFESGLDEKGSLAWAKVHDAVAENTRACAYSRAGIMWSDSPDEFSSQGVARDLHATLKGAGEKGPFVLVGHSLGGPYNMVFTRLFPDEVAGLVFVDAAHPDQEATLEEVIPLKIEDALPMFRLMDHASWTGATRVLMGQSQTGVANQPEGVPEAGTAYAPHSIGEIRQEVELMRETFVDAAKLQTLADRPTFVLTATAPVAQAQLDAMQMKLEDVPRYRELWVSLHVDMASWSSNSKHLQVPEASHYIQFDTPELVIEAIAWVVDQVNAQQAVTEIESEAITE